MEEDREKEEATVEEDREKEEATVEEAPPPHRANPLPRPPVLERPEVRGRKETPKGRGTKAEKKDTKAEKKDTKAEKLSGADTGITGKTRNLLRSQRQVKIKIASTETQKDDVTVGLNGHTYVIKRDEWVEVPMAVAEVLENAKMTLYEQKLRTGPGAEGYELEGTETARFPFQSRERE